MDREEFEKMAAAGKLERHHIASLVLLTESGFCMHRSWGFGRIKTVDTVFARFTIDFDTKAGHTMDLAFAAESLKPIPKTHVLARKAYDLDTLRHMAATNSLELVKMVISSFGGQATVDQVQQVLVPDVVREDWKKWWEGAKRQLKQDGHFQVPLKKTEPIVYQEKEVSLQNRLLEEFRAAKGLKARIAVTAELLRNANDLSDKKAGAAEVIAALNAELGTYVRTQPAVALEAIFARDDMQTMAELPASPEQVQTQAIWAPDAQLGAVLEQLPAAKHRRALETFKAANPEHWHEAVRLALNTSPAKLCRELAGLLIQEGKMDVLKETLARLISQHMASTELLLWLAKDRNDSFADILGPEVFRAMLTAMERDQFNEKRSNRLRDYILDDQELLVELIGSADFEVIKDHELVEKKIPANSKEIAVARSYGDLRENHEYKAAKEMQKLLMRRKAELETQLLRARGTDFSNVRTDIASIGTIVVATDLQTQQPERYTILGAWDSDPDKNLVSYQSPVAQSLIGHKVSDEVEFELHGVIHRHRIESIQAYKVPQPAATAQA
jgi:transcription elongation factor GreA-like protein